MSALAGAEPKQEGRVNGSSFGRLRLTIVTQVTATRPVGVYLSPQQAFRLG